MLILFPYAEASRFGSYAFRLIGSFAILVSVYAANIHRSLLIFAVVLAIPALFQRMVLPKVSANSFSIFNIVLSFVFEPTSETIFGALCVYLLVGFTFATVYGMLAAFQPNPFYLDPRTNLHNLPDRFDLIYYSFGTMTSLGAAGITPVSSQARFLFYPRSYPGRPVPCRPDRKIDRSLPPQLQRTRHSVIHLMAHQGFP